MECDSTSATWRTWVCKRSVAFAGNRPQGAKRLRLGERPSKRAEGDALSKLLNLARVA